MGVLFAFFVLVSPVDYNQTAQVVAQARVNYMADHNFRGHPPGLQKAWAVGARFEGAGWGRRGRNPRTLGTCRPHRSRRMRIIADAVAVGRWGTYRIRLWR